ncbi:MAG: BspA family leucine-rich repeat surface protein, partial [Bacilli bacterium]|nr:BspA family leucine-rich repeat surface protein [Bacilli bacterium]
IGKLSSEEIEITFSNNTSSSQTINANLLFTFTKLESMMAEGNKNAATSTFYNGPLTKDSIESITFMPTKEIPEEAIGYWDCSYNAGSNEVIAYYLNGETEGMYDLYIAADGEVYAPVSASSLFHNFNKLVSINFNDSFNTEKSTNMASMFSNCSSLTSLDLSSFNTENVTSMSFMFMNLSKLEELDVSNFNTLKVTTLANTFVGCKALKELDLNSWYTPNLVAQYNAGNGLFTNCSSLKILKIDNFDTSKMNNMRQMFQGCTSLISVDVSSFDTSNVTNMQAMFSGCKALTELNLANFNTAKVTTMANMFNSCSQLKSINLSNFNTEKVTSMTNLFQLCTSLKKINLTGWNTKKVTNMSGMFSYCSALEEIEGLSYFEIDSITTLGGMFMRSPKLTTIDISGMDFENKSVTTTNMFESTPSGSTIYVKNEYNKEYIENIKSGLNVIIPET